MTFSIETFSDEEYAGSAASLIASELLGRGSLVVTGGSGAAAVYPELARAAIDWSLLQIFFTDERCVHPEDDASNYGMVRRLLLGPAGARNVQRIRGEDRPQQAAADYARAIGPAVERGFDLLVLGMGDDNHIAALFPGSPALRETRLCADVERPDGMMGVTLTPPALISAAKILVLVTGSSKADAVARAAGGIGDVNRRPVRLLDDHPDVTLVLDEAAAEGL